MDSLPALLKTQTLTRCKPFLGTFVEVTLTGRETQQTLITYSEQVFDEIQRIESALSFFDENSELSQFNRWASDDAVGTFKLSEDFFNVLSFALKLYRQSHQLFDVTIAPHLIKQGALPQQSLVQRLQGVEYWGNSSDITIFHHQVAIEKPLIIDFGGIAKGYAVDKAFAKVPKFIGVVINAGGDLRTRPWQEREVYIQYGKRKSSTKRQVMLDSAIATSGNYLRNGSVMINPKTGKQISRGGAISVFAHSAMMADALTKVVWLLAENKATYYQAQYVLNQYKAKAISINRFGWRREIN